MDIHFGKEMKAISKKTMEEDGKPSKTSMSFKKALTELFKFAFSITSIVIIWTIWALSVYAAIAPMAAFDKIILVNVFLMYLSILILLNRDNYRLMACHLTLMLVGIVLAVYKVLHASKVEAEWAVMSGEFARFYVHMFVVDVVGHLVVLYLAVPILMKVWDAKKKQKVIVCSA